MDTGFSATQLYSACRLTFTHYYEPADHTPRLLYGTGFITGFSTPDNRFALVTNRHLTDIPWVEPNRDGTVLKSVKVELWQSKNLRIEFDIQDPTTYFHVDPYIDICVIPFGPAIDTNAKGYPFDKIENLIPDLSAEFLEFKHGLSWEYLLECETLWGELGPGESVAFPGYPIWFDRLQNRPVFRSGVIASDPQTDYRSNSGEPTIHDGNQQILFDAFSTNGNSGSPVFVAQRGIPPVDLQLQLAPGSSAQPANARLEFSGYRRSFLIGINAGHFNDVDYKQVEEERTDEGADETETVSADAIGLRQSANDHAGLSRMHKLSAIMEILRANADTEASAEVSSRILIRKPAEDDA
ncbi:hypothetical protein [Mycobacterium pseudokansasii]|uniref:Serine protease n=1 Tax=Mycobacterium pseudokansasii TaxID=2341080 RepID=A0A498QUT5_9MYCO|nr:hypothetical protein [Mycobacterium pseudokansasii]KZS60427.1 hypothetical protein A4G27_05975 [Mycobacterium kansasii]VAZ99019.1 hypothetical protein LAUMK35_04198 [Mycobacterium pseudokansasii]VBA30210.1 hypothetical protein LAUMK21_04193 [Mycobacterium pseudokansasii]VBA53489.1 hypothetical protein LAUMK142_04088 [Mycobacterium pseudokansasii]